MKLPMPFAGSLPALCALAMWGCTAQLGDPGADSPAVADGRSSTGEPAESHSVGNGPSKQSHTNRLANETSPYLLMHAHNPVDWYPWGPEAFDKAQQEDKPIFLSIGYSSCYWCHVMERLVFSDEDIARYMNEHFVNIKVDREERPDVDDVYMTALSVYFQLIQSPQGGGWPLSMFLTPAGKPFAGGTYFPPQDKDGRLGFPSVMRRVVDLWENNRKQIESNADLLTREVQRIMKPSPLSPLPASRGVHPPGSPGVRGVEPDRQLVLDAVKAVLGSYDPDDGGLDFRPSSPNAPKFPVPAKLALLQYAVRRYGNEEAGKAVYHTLDQMAAGGIHDHLGGGFHRYSTDRRWHVPHFEKMLYDQAQLAGVYVEAYRRTHKPLYRETAEDVFDYVLREMTDARGGFHSALDAETDGIEGKYYVWTRAEVEDVLGEDDAPLFERIYGMDEPSPFEHGYVLHLPQPVEEVAGKLNRSPHELANRLSGMREKLLEARQQRPRPFKDDKVLTGWNGLMIRALADGAAVLGRSDYRKAAEQAAMFILSEMRDDQGRLLRSYRAGEAKLNAYLDDYAFLVEGLLALYETTGDEKWLNAAHHLTNDQIELFWDEKGNAFFFTSHHHEHLIARTKNANDSVLPAGNSVSVRNLIRLASLTGDETYHRYAKEIIDVFASNVQRSPGGTATLALAIGEYLDNPDFAAARSPRTDSDAPSAPATQSLRSIQQMSAVSSGTEDADATNQNGKQASIVAAKVYLSVDKLPAGQSCRIAVILDIRDGWHVNANPARPEFLIPTTVTLASKQGTRLTGLQFPKSKELAIPGIEQTLQVYEKRAVIQGVLEVGASANGAEDMDLHIRYQACNDQQCLAPKTIKLHGTIPVARAGEPVTRINRALFPDNAN